MREMRCPVRTILVDLGRIYPRMHWETEAGQRVSPWYPYLSNTNPIPNCLDKHEDESELEMAAENGLIDLEVELVMHDHEKGNEAGGQENSG